MKKLVLRPRAWGRRFVEVMDSLFSGGTPFTAIPQGPPWSVGSAVEGELSRRMAGAQDAYRLGMGAQAGAIGGYGGQLLARLRGSAISYPYSTGVKQSILQEGKVSVQVKFNRIDKEHVLVEVDCVRRIVHTVKELKEVAVKLIEEYAEQYVFGEQPKNTRAPQHEPGTVIAAASSTKGGKRK